MSRRPDHIKRSARLTKAERAAMLLEQGGICATPGCGSTGPFEEDHGAGAEAVALGNTGKPKYLRCKPCNRNGGIVIAKIAAKADRQGLRSGQQARLKKRGFSLIKSRNDLSRKSSGMKRKIPVRAFERKVK